MFPFIPFILFPLIAGIIAVAGYCYLAKRQPEYPNGRVIATFTLLVGGLGGLLVTFLIYLTVVISSPSPLIDDSLPQRFLPVSVLLGGGMGCAPAALCGVLLAKEQLIRAWKSSLIAAWYGVISGVVAGIIFLNIPASLFFAPIGALSAAILSAMVLPKANKTSEAA